MKRRKPSGELSGRAAAERAEVAALASKVVSFSGQRSAVQGTPARADRGPAPTPVQPRGWFWWICLALFWTGTIFLAALAALRIIHHDGTYFLTWFNAFTRYLYMPAYPVVIWAAWHRRWWLATLSLLIVVCHIVWMAPNFLRDRRFDVPIEATISDSPSVRIFFANVLGTNRHHDEIFDEIAAAKPDLVILAEFAASWQKALRRSPAMEPYIYGAGMRRTRMGMTEVFSKLPLKTEMQNRIAGRVVHTVDVELGSRTLRLMGLHAPRPVYLPEYDYEGFWSQLLPLVATESGPLVVIGDFNATEHSLVYNRLQRMGLRSAHDDRGRGYATTWPNGVFLLPPIRIDQAFISPEVECERIVEGRGKGSDHKPLILDIRIRGGG